MGFYFSGDLWWVFSTGIEVKMLRSFYVPERIIQISELYTEPYFSQTNFSLGHIIAAEKALFPHKKKISLRIQ